MRLVQHDNGGGDSTDGETYDTDNEELDERVANWGNGGKQPVYYIGMSTRETDPLTGRSRKTMRRQASTLSPKLVVFDTFRAVS